MRAATLFGVLPITTMVIIGVGVLIGNTLPSIVVAGVLGAVVLKLIG